MEQSTAVGGGGGACPHNWVSSLQGCSTRVRTGPMGRDGRGSASMTVSFRPSTPRTDYTSWASPKHLMCMCFPHAPQAQRVLPLRQCVHKRRIAKRFGACTVGTAAVGVV